MAVGSSCYVTCEHNVADSWVTRDALVIASCVQKLAKTTKQMAAIQAKVVQGKGSQNHHTRCGSVWHIIPRLCT